MPGIRKFDEDAVLDRVMNAFWERGYEGTSVDDLVLASGLKRGSLYNAFGDKEKLFLRALERYSGRFSGPILSPLCGSDPRRALACMFDAQITGMSAPGHPAGCLMVNTFAEAGHHGDLVGQAARRFAVVFEDTLYDLLRRAQAAGTLAVEHDARALARFFAAVSRSLALSHRSGGDERALRDVVRTALLVLDAPPAPGKAQAR